MSVHTGALALVGAAFLATAVLSLMRVSASRGTAIAIASSTLAAGVLGASVLSSLLHPGQSSPALSWAFDGAIILGGAVAWILASLLGVGSLRALDAMAPAACIAAAIARLGCYVEGCCRGVPTDVPWATPWRAPMPVMAGEIGLHPTQLYEFAAALAVLLVVFCIRKRDCLPGVAAFACLFLVSGFRAINFQFRQVDTSAIVSPWILSAALAVAGVFGLFAIAFRPKRVGANAAPAK
jgi:phosphatidylglycerol:prolipoprotein diacylglycerol transferase